MKKLNVFVIHADYILNRKQFINTTLQKLKDILGKIVDIDFHFVKEPTKDFIISNIQDFNNRVQYEKENVDEEFSNTIQSLNPYQISNIEKHRVINKIISEKFTNDLNLIIEDDVLVVDEFIDNLVNAVKIILENNNWDFIFTCVSNLDEKPLQLVDMRDSFKLLISKSSYFVKPKMAKKLSEYLEIFKYNLKTAISCFIWKNKDIKSFIFNKHLFIEGSKYGIFTSTINNSNFLYQNGSFMQIIKALQEENVSEETIKDIEKVYEEIKHMNSPDISHYMGLFYHKIKNYDKAKYYMTDAYDKLVNTANPCYAVISRNNEILNNAINMYQYEQNMLEECSKKQSKYMS